MSSVCDPDRCRRRTAAMPAAREEPGQAGAVFSVCSGPAAPPGHTGRHSWSGAIPASAGPAILDIDTTNRT